MKKIEPLFTCPKIKIDAIKLGANFTGTLDLGRENIGEKGCRHLAPALAEMKGLKDLYLGNNNIGDEGCRHLAPALACC